MTDRHTFTAPIPGTYHLGFGQPHLISECTGLCRRGAVWEAPAAWLELDRPARNRARRTVDLIRVRIALDREAAGAATPGPWESDGDDLYSIHDGEHGDRVGDQIAFLRCGRIGENEPNGQHMVRYGPDRVLLSLDALWDLLADLERIAERAPHPDPRDWARSAIRGLANVVGVDPDDDDEGAWAHHQLLAARLRQGAIEHKSLMHREGLHESPAAGCRECEREEREAWIDGVRAKLATGLAAAAKGHWPQWDDLPPTYYVDSFALLDPLPPVVPEPKRRAHHCDETCRCPADELPMHYAPSTGQHACQDPACQHAHPGGPEHG